MTAPAAVKNGLYAALAAVQAELPAIAKTETANAGTYTYDYAGLDTVTHEIMPLLGKHDLAFTAWPTLNSDGKFILAYSLLHSSGESRSGEYPLPSSGSAQQIGSAITYARRYCLCAVTGVAPGGDDNDAAGVPEQAMDKPRPRTAYSDPDHVRLTRESPDELANGRGPADRVRGRIPDDDWTAAPEDEPGSIGPPQVRDLQRLLSKMFARDEREQRLNAASVITGRKLKTSSDLSYAEAEKLITVLKGLVTAADKDGVTPREKLIDLLVPAPPTSSAADPQNHPPAADVPGPAVHPSPLGAVTGSGGPGTPQEGAGDA